MGLTGTGGCQNAGPVTYQTHFGSVTVLHGVVPLFPPPHHHHSSNPTTTASNCSQGGNGCNYKTAREWQCPHQTKWIDKTMGDEEGAKQMKKRAQEMLFDISWAIGKFFLLISVYFFLLTDFFN
jgi:hypothetical protein